MIVQTLDKIVVNLDDSEIVEPREVPGVCQLMHNVDRNPQTLVALAKQPKDVKE